MSGILFRQIRLVNYKSEDGEESKLEYSLTINEEV